jgi:hypothetical protein
MKSEVKEWNKTLCADGTEAAVAAAREALLQFIKREQAVEASVDILRVERRPSKDGTHELQISVSYRTEVTPDQWVVEATRDITVGQGPGKVAA